MNKQELEDLYILSLDEKLSSTGLEQFMKTLKEHPDWARSLAQHKKARELLRAHSPATFGPSFASALVHKIQNTGIVMDRQIFGTFKKFQLAALGVVVALLILNMMFSEQRSWKSVLGIEDNGITTPAPNEQEVPFDFSQTLNNP